ncbi:Adenine phosphoribosyltransferase [Salinispira pacifica]|uniref:Adenine phosphoribosyltransferase n=2 Tax=Salinispira pacifica TaxID=1307761 RepID=V5WI25_9SPIO|nr:Adenine phosphoribosyltransferase [Salinispira pacifica]
MLPDVRERDMNLKEFDESIRRVKDFPKPGINFYDITSILTNSEAFGYCLEQMNLWIDELEVDTLLAVEARGFLFAAPLAQMRKIPLVLARKKGKLPGKTWCEEYSLEYGTDVVCIQQEDIAPGSRVLLIDDLIATGGTLKATAALVKNQARSSLAGYAAVIGLPFLGYEKHLDDAPIRTLINYQGE